MPCDLCKVMRLVTGQTSEAEGLASSTCPTTCTCRTWASRGEVSGLLGDMGLRRVNTRYRGCGLEGLGLCGSTAVPNELLEEAVGDKASKDGEVVGWGHDEEIGWAGGPEVVLGRSWGSDGP